MPDYKRQYDRSQKLMNKPSKETPMPGDIWWVQNLDGVKDRPVLIISCFSGTVNYRKCTSQSNNLYPRDVIEDIVSAGLEKETYVAREVMSIPRSRLHHKMGELSDYDREKFHL